MDTNKIITGDNITVLRTFPDNCIDLVVTSPPYDGLRDYKGYTLNIPELIKELYRVMKQGGVIVWVVGDETENGTESGESFRQSLQFKEHGFNLHDTMIYAKNSFQFPSNNRYHQVFEYMFVFSKGIPTTFNPIKDKLNKNTSNFPQQHGRTGKDEQQVYSKNRVKIEKFGMRYNIWEYKIGGGNITQDKIAYKHPAIFPEELAEDHILSWSKKGDLVLDPFSGSGTTCKMAYLNDRQYIGIDISKEYNQIAEVRLKLASPKAHQDNNPKTNKTGKLSRYS